VIREHLRICRNISANPNNGAVLTANPKDAIVDERESSQDILRIKQSIMTFLRCSKVTVFLYIVEAGIIA